VRAGVLGGTFDPPHLGHVALASAAALAFGLERVWMVPARVPPHKAAASANAYHRFAMTALCCRGSAVLAPHPVELRREGPSYTVDTLHEMVGRWGVPVLVMGSDTLADFPGWREPEGILQLACVGALARVGHPVDEVVEGLPEWLRQRVARVGPGEEPDLAPGRVYLGEGEVPEVSSTEARRALAAGGRAEGLLEPAVLEYVSRAGLYRR
jgi:nicotinate-nucleotide adenylyltransferase